MSMTGCFGVCIWAVRCCEAGCDTVLGGAGLGVLYSCLIGRSLRCWELCDVPWPGRDTDIPWGVPAEVCCLGAEDSEDECR